MHFVLTDEQRFFHETTRRFLDSEMPTTGVRALAGVRDGFERNWWQRGAELGWTSLLVDDVNGGGNLSGNGVLDLVIVAEEFGRHVSAGPLVPCNTVASALDRSGSDGQRGEFLPGLLDGRYVGAWCHDPTVLRAERDGDGFLISGVVEVVEAAAQADCLLVTAQTEGGITNFLLRGDEAGIQVIPRESVDLVRRFARVSFHGVSATSDAIVGRADHGAGDAEWLRRLVVVLQCAEMCGAAARVFEFTLEYAFDRYSFGRPLASYQALKHRFADMKMWLETCHAMTDAAAASLGDADPDAARFVAAAKAYVADRAPEIVQDCIQMHGGIGVTWEHDVHLFLRRIALNAGLFGTSLDHRERVGRIIAAGAKG